MDYSKQSKKEIIKEIRSNVKGFTDILTSATDLHKALYEIVGRCDRETSDVIHDIEFSVFNAKEGFSKAKQLKTIRRDRRDAKELMEYIVLLKKFVDNHNRITEDLKRLFYDIDSVAEAQKNRVYSPREKEGEPRHFESSDD